MLAPFFSKVRIWPLLATRALIVQPLLYGFRAWMGCAARRAPLPAPPLQRVRAGPCKQVLQGIRLFPSQASAVSGLKGAHGV